MEDPMLLLLWLACAPDDPALSGTSSVDPAPTSPSHTPPVLPTLTPTDSGLDEGTDPALVAAQAMYDPDHVALVEIVIDEADALALSQETNEIFDLLYGEDCLDEPWSGPFNWYPADVTVDGVLRTDVGVRKKGLIGSLSTDKPSLKLDYDTFVEGQTLDGLERLTLNNSISDPSLVKQCLGYQLFRDAGLPSPRCHFASVSANGDALGVYVSVEPVKKDFLRWAFDGDDDGDLYEGTLADFRDGWMGTFEPDTNDTDPTKAPLQAVTDALAIDDDEQMLAALGEVLDLDAFYRFWAMEVIVGHLDGYAGNTNNYYVYVPEETGKLVFIPWGIDAIFLRFASFGSDTTLVTLNNSALTRRLWEVPSEQQRYRDTLQELLDTLWDEQALLDEVARMEALTDPYALPDDGWREAELANLRAFIATRQGELEAALAAPTPSFDEPLRDDICIVDNGELSVVLDTTWGTLDTYDPLGEGSSTLVGSVDGLGFDLAGSAIAGFEADGDYVTLAALAWHSPTVLSYAVVQLPSWEVQPGVSVPIDGLGRVALLAQIDFAVSEDAVIVGSMWDGTLTIDTFTGVDGSPVSATFSGTLYGGGP
jgi:spore coat protein CotH